jgi:nucleoside-diphosphate-sugar epimerase
MRILITGGLGFVGAATRPMAPDYFYRHEHDWFIFDAMRGQDIRDKAQFAAAVGEWKPDRILHLAAIARFADADADPVKAVETNAIGTKNVAEVASERHIPLVYASTGSVYMPIKQKPPITEEFQACGNSVYGCTKYAGELYVRQSKAPWIILRYAHLYGKEKRMHGLIGGFLDRINRGMAPTLYGGRQSNDFTYIKDVARANLLALESPWDKWNQVYNIGTGEELTAEAAGKIVCEVFGYTGRDRHQGTAHRGPGQVRIRLLESETMLGFKAEYDFRTGLEDMKNASGQDDQDLAPRALRIA